MRENLRDLVLKTAGAAKDAQLSLVRWLAKRVLITRALEFNELYELMPPVDGASEYIGEDLPEADQVLPCITIRDFCPEDQAHGRHELMRRAGLHLRALATGARSEVDLDVLRHVYIEPHDRETWSLAILKWRSTAPLDDRSMGSTSDGEARQARRYQLCVDKGLKMPDNSFAALPRGIGKLAEQEGITRQAFAEDVKAHIARIYGR